MWSKLQRFSEVAFSLLHRKNSEGKVVCYFSLVVTMPFWRAPSLCHDYGDLLILPVCEHRDITVLLFLPLPFTWLPTIHGGGVIARPGSSSFEGSTTWAPFRPATPLAINSNCKEWRDTIFYWQTSTIHGISFKATYERDDGKFIIAIFRRFKIVNVKGGGCI